MKYIILSHCYMYMFPSSVSHDEFLISLHTDKTCTSAGFISEGKCYGKSDSLGIGMGDRDNELLTLMMTMKAL